MRGSWAQRPRSVVDFPTGAEFSSSAQRIGGRFSDLCGVFGLAGAFSGRFPTTADFSTLGIDGEEQKGREQHQVNCALEPRCPSWNHSEDGNNNGYCEQHHLSGV